MKSMMILTASTSMIFSLMKHPLAMGLVLLLQTTLTCMISGMMLKSFWLSYVLFLIFIGGMLVLFIYVTTLASNEMFKFSMKMLAMMIMSMVIISLMLNINHSMETSPTWSEAWMNTATQDIENSKLLTKLYNSPTMVITIMLAIYMLLTLIVVVKITTITKGPLRSSS
nr:NADH dehydrogenase subunit 6 [Anaplecta sp. 4 ZQW-2020]